MCEDLRRLLVLDAKAEPAWKPGQRERHRRNTERHFARIDRSIAKNPANDGTDSGIYNAAERVLKPRLYSRNTVRRMGARSYISRQRRSGSDYAGVGNITKD